MPALGGGEEAGSEGVAGSGVEEAEAESDSLPVKPSPVYSSLSASASAAGAARDAGGYARRAWVSCSGASLAHQAARRARAPSLSAATARPTLFLPLGSPASGCTALTRQVGQLLLGERDEGVVIDGLIDAAHQVIRCRVLVAHHA